MKTKYGKMQNYAAFLTARLNKCSIQIHTHIQGHIFPVNIFFSWKLPDIPLTLTKFLDISLPFVQHLWSYNLTALYKSIIIIISYQIPWHFQVFQTSTVSIRKRTHLFDFLGWKVGKVCVFAVLLLVWIDHHCKLLTWGVQQVQHNTQVRWARRRRAAAHVW